MAISGVTGLDGAFTLDLVVKDDLVDACMYVIYELEKAKPDPTAPIKTARTTWGKTVRPR